MHCPYCGNINTRYSQSLSLHFLRVLFSSQKRYCPSCDKKWIAGPKTKQMSVQVALTLLLIAGLSTLFINEAGSLSFYMKKIQIAGPSAALSPKLIQKAQKKLKEDPDFLTRLSPEKRKRAAAAMKKYGLDLPK